MVWQEVMAACNPYPVSAEIVGEFKSELRSQVWMDGCELVVGRDSEIHDKMGAWGRSTSGKVIWIYLLI
jgi:hypothetical protein